MGSLKQTGRKTKNCIKEKGEKETFKGSILIKRRDKEKKSKEEEINDDKIYKFIKY